MQRPRSTAIALSVLIAAMGWACSETIVGVVGVASVQIQPSPATVFVGADLSLQVTLRDDGGNVLSGRAVSWSSDDAQVASVNAEGVVHGVSEGQTRITATSEGIQGSVNVTVLARPVIAVDPPAVEFVVTRGEAAASETIDVTNTGGATLQGMTVAVDYGLGAAGWLDATLSTPTAPATLTLTPDAGSLATGTHNALVRIHAPDAANTPAGVAVRIDVLDPVPAHIAIAGGNGQTTVAGSPVAEPLAVLVTDASDDPLPGVRVTFFVASGGGFLAGNGAVFSNAQGIATAPTWTLGPVVGTNTVKAIAEGLPADTVTFTATATTGAAAKLGIVTQPSVSAPSGAVFQRQPVVQLQDANGNAVEGEGVNVTAAMASGGGTLGGTVTVATAANGRAAFTDLVITGTIGNRTLEFSAPGLASVISSVIAITTNTGTQLALQTQPSATAPSGVPFAQQPVVQVRDAGGNPVAQAGIVITASIDSGGGTLGGMLSVSTDASGRATFTDLRITGTVGSRRLRFSASGIAPAISDPVAITVGAPSATHTTATVPDGTAGSPTTIGISVHDSGGNPVTGVANDISVTVTGANSATPTVTETGNGGYSAAYTPTVAGSDQIAVALGGTPISGSPFESVVIPSGVSTTNSTVTASAASAIANGTDAIRITVDVRDSNNNPIPGLVGAIEVQLTGTAAAGSVTAGAVAGTYTFDVTSTVANPVVIAVTVGGIALADQESVTFVPGPVSASTSSFSASPTSLTVGSSSTVTVHVRDANNNPISGLADAAFTIGGLGNAQRGTVTETGTAGSYTFTVTNAVAQTITVTVSVNSTALTGTGTITFTPGAVSGSTSSFSANPTSLTVGSSSTVTVHVRDANDNPISGLTDAAFTVGGLGNAQKGTVTATATAGDYTFTVTNTTAETITVTVSVSGVALTGTGTITFTPGAVSASTSSFSASPTSLTAGSASTVTVHVRDANDNPISGLADAAFTVGGLGNAQKGTVTPTATAGDYTFSVTNTTAETISVTVSVSGVALTGTGTITFTPGAVSASTSSFSASPTSVTVGNASTVTVHVRDANDNPISGLTDAAFTVGGLGNAQKGTVTATATAGDYTFTVTNTTAETITVTVSVSGVALTGTGTITFTPGAVSASTSSFSASPTSLTAGSASTVTVHVRDANDNPISGLADAAFTVGGLGNAQKGTVTATATAGDYTFTVTNTTAETITVTVSVSGVALTGTGTITFTPGAVSASTSSFSASPTSVTVGNASTVTVHVRDANDNPISGLTDAAFTIGGLGNAQKGTVTATATAGDYTFTVTNTTAETITVTVSVSGVALTGTGTITFTPGAVSASTSSFSASPTSVTVGNASTVTVHVRDANDNPISGLTDAAFTVGGLGNAQKGTVTPTATAGDYTFSVTNTTAETIAVTVSVNGVALTGTGTITFTPGPVSASTSSFSASPTSLTVGSASTVTVHVRDANDNPISGLTDAAFTVGGLGNAQKGTVTATATAGDYTFSVTNTTAETIAVTVSVNGVALTGTGTITFTPGPVSASTSSFSASPASLTVGNASIVTVHVRDANDNPISGLADAAFTIGGLGNAQRAQ